MNTFQDPQQFAYCPRVGVDDAIYYLLKLSSGQSRQHGGDHVLFSSAFNTIQPALLCEKLQKIQLVASTITWIIDIVVSSTGAPQGTVRSPFFFTLYTSDNQYNSDDCKCISDEQGVKYRELVHHFVAMKWEQSPYPECKQVIGKGCGF